MDFFRLFIGSDGRNYFSSATDIFHATINCVKNKNYSSIKYKKNMNNYKSSWKKVTNLKKICYKLFYFNAYMVVYRE